MIEQPYRVSVSWLEDGEFASADAWTFARAVQEYRWAISVFEDELPEEHPSAIVGLFAPDGSILQTCAV